MNEYKNIKQLGHCPICGSTEFIVLAKVTGIVPYVHSLSGKKCENDAMYDGLAYSYNKWCVCADCGKKYLLMNRLLLIMVFNIALVGSLSELRKEKIGIR